MMPPLMSEVLWSVLRWSSDWIIIMAASDLKNRFIYCFLLGYWTIAQSLVGLYSCETPTDSKLTGSSGFSPFISMSIVLLKPRWLKVVTIWMVLWLFLRKREPSGNASESRVQITHNHCNCSYLTTSMTDLVEMPTN